MDNLSVDSQPYAFITLPPFALGIVGALRARTEQVDMRVKELKRLLKGDSVKPTSAPSGGGDDGGDDSEAELEDTGGNVEA